MDEGPQRHGRVAKLRVHQKLGQRIALSQARYDACLALQGHFGVGPCFMTLCFGRDVSGMLLRTTTILQEGVFFHQGSTLRINVNTVHGAQPAFKSMVCVIHTLLHSVQCPYAQTGCSSKRVGWAKRSSSVRRSEDAT